ncbi:hypothetical protein [Lacticaseibacillus zhaodongensis]|uniref:hypothetical protein n=1 Tax=Lacticaseibacillus zhaodongensis TaxID=2668065 RepID=UPI0012D36764|nr:hypothetical protein [Lacticaseibacillus zhaodongensis]
MNRNMRAPFEIGLGLSIIILLAGAFMDNFNILTVGCAILGAVLILAGAAVCFFQHTELLSSAREPIPFKELSHNVVVIDVIIGIIFIIAGVLLLLLAQHLM